MLGRAMLLWMAILLLILAGPSALYAQDETPPDPTPTAEVVTEADLAPVDTEPEEAPEVALPEITAQQVTLPGGALLVNGATGTVGNADACPDPRPSATYLTVQKAVTCAFPGDTVGVEAGTYNEGVTVDKDLTLTGVGADLAAIDGGDAVRVLTVDGPVVVTVQHLTLSNGFTDADGGALFTDNGAVTLDRVALTGSTAARGGGFATNAGTVIVSHSTVANNAATAGGGIFSNAGTVTLTNTTISGNGATDGGGIFSVAGNIMLAHSTVADNSATGDGGSLFTTAGLFAPTHTILLTATGAADECVGTVTSGGFNIASDGTCNLAGGGDQPSTDPLLDPLGDNGGTTQTHLLAENSPALDAGDPAFSAPPNGDQRDLARVFGGRIDIGAVEMQPDLVELVTNGDFGDSLNNWFAVGDIATDVIDGELLANRTNEAGFAFLAQPLASPADTATAFEFSVDFGNSSGLNQPVEIVLMELGGADQIACAFTIPASQAGPKSYRMVGFPTGNWADTDLRIFFNGPNASGVLVDNVSVTQNDELTPVGVECTQPETPTNTNLVSNGTFDVDSTGWFTVGDVGTAVDNTAFDLTRNAGTPFVAQPLAYPLATDTPLAFSVDLRALTANTTVVLTLKDLGSADEMFCAFTVPGASAAAPLETFTLNGVVGADWTGIDVRLFVLDGDGLTVDNVSVTVPDPAPVETEVTCTEPTTPIETNLLANGDFSAEATNWFVQGQFNGGYNNGRMNLTRDYTQPGDFALLSNLVHRPVDAGTPLSLTLELGNTSDQPKNVTVALRQFGPPAEATAAQTDEIFCLLTVPANASDLPVALRGVTGVAWEKIDIFIFVDDFNQNRLRVDNIDLQVKPNLEITETECDRPDAPDQTTLLVNGDFSFGDAFWFFYGQREQAIDGGMLMLQRVFATLGDFALAAQPLRYDLPQGVPVEMTVDLGNSSDEAKNVTLVLKDLEAPLGQADEVVCFVTVPPNTSLQTYTVRGVTSESWEGLDVLVFVDDFGGPTLSIDNIIVQTRTDLNPQGIGCGQPANPAGANLVANAGFDGGAAFWFIPSQTTEFDEQNGVLRMTRIDTSDSALGVLAQPMRRGAAMTVPLQLQIELGNSTGTPKRLDIQLANRGGQAERLLCPVVVPGNATLATYTLQGVPSFDWDAIDVQVLLRDFNEAGLLVDNVRVSAEPGLTPVGTVCGYPATPTDTQLLVNGDFTNDLFEWNPLFDIDIDVVDGVVEANKTEGDDGFALLSNLARFSVAQGDPLQLQIELGNSAEIPQSLNVVLADPNNAASEIVCPVTLGPSEALGTHTIRGLAPASWDGVDVKIWVDPEAPSLLVDNAVLTVAANAGWTDTECLTPSNGVQVAAADEVMPTETETLTPEITETVIATETATEATDIAPVGPQTVEFEMLPFAANWLVLEDAEASGGAHLVNTAPDAVFETTFSGDAVTLTYTAGPVYGGFIVEIDGALAAAVDANAEALAHAVAVTVTAQTPGEHTLRVVPAGTIALDTLTVYPTETPTDEPTVVAVAPTEGVVVEPEALEPQSSETVETVEAVTPETLTPEGITPETVTPVTITPETLTPVTVTPETVTPVTVTPEPSTPEPLTVPAAANLEVLAVDGAWVRTEGGWTSTEAALNGPHSLTWTEQVSLTNVTRPVLQVRGERSGAGTAEIQLSTDRTNWTSLGAVGAAEGVALTEVNLSGWLGQPVTVRVLWTPPGGDNPEPSSWTVGAIRIVDLPVTPETLTPETATVEPTDEATETAEPSETATEVTPETVTPETPTPETVTPETLTPEAVTPETVTPETLTPDVTEPPVEEAGDAVPPEAAIEADDANTETPIEEAPVERVEGGEHAAGRVVVAGAQVQQIVGVGPLAGEAEGGLLAAGGAEGGDCPLARASARRFLGYSWLCLSVWGGCEMIAYSADSTQSFYQISGSKMGVWSQKTMSNQQTSISYIFQHIANLFTQANAIPTTF